MIDFDRMIDNHLKREERPRQVGRYYPSEIGNCVRKVWYSYKHPVEPDADKIKVFEMGNMLHDFVVRVLKSEKNTDVELIDSEFPFKQEIDDFLISGRIDNLILVKSNSKKVLVEVKSTKNIASMDKAPEPYAAQLMLYMHFLKIHDGVLLFLDKNTLKSKVIPVAYDENEAKRVIHRFKVLHKHLKENKPPIPEARLFERSMWMCGYCEYRERCYKEVPPNSNYM